MLRNRANTAREKLGMSHPRDRHVRQLEKKQKRADKLLNNKDKLKVGASQKVIRFFWFREQCLALGYTGQAVPEDVIHTLAQINIDRNNAEIAELKALRNPPVGRIKQLVAQRDMEMDAYRSSKGLEVPDLSDGDAVEVLTRLWDGESETVVVVSTAKLSLGKRPLDDAAHKEEVLEKLKPLNEIREQSTSILPKRALRFHAKGSDIAVKTKQQRSSAKKADTSLAAVQSRSKTATVRKQQDRLKQRRDAILAIRRE